jgi:hypothetical protein
MKQEFNRFRLIDDSKLKRDTKSPKSPLDHLDLATRHTIFFRKVEDQKSLQSLPGENTQKHWDINQQNKVAKEREESQENSCTADESLTQACVEHVSQAKTGRREGFACTLDSAETSKRESSESSWETVKSLAGESLTRLREETVGRAWQTLAGKSLTQLAKETVEWTWQNGVKALSWKKCMRLMVMYLTVSAPFAADAVKIYGKNGCSIDSHLSIDMYTRGYENDLRIVKEQFKQTFPKLVERYAKDPCDKKFEKIRVTLKHDLGRASDGGELFGYMHASEPTHLFWKLGNPFFESLVIHEFSHVPQFIDGGTCKIRNDKLTAYHWLMEAHASYNTLVYSPKLDTRHLRFPPNLWPSGHYTALDADGPVGGFMLWLDKKFPGYVDKSNRMAQEKCISWEDLEKLTGRQSLESLWQKYKKINFATEMLPFIEGQRRKYLGSDQQRSQAGKIKIGVATLMLIFISWMRCCQIRPRIEEEEQFIERLRDGQQFRERPRDRQQFRERPRDRQQFREGQRYY